MTARSITALVLAATLSGCGFVTHSYTPDEARNRRYVLLEEQLVKYSKQINAFNAEHGGLGSAFDETAFSTTLAAVHPTGPEHDAAARLRDSYLVRARRVSGDYYSLMVCDPVSKAKLMEDFSCDTTHVEVTPWKSTSVVACEFEADASRYCTAR